LQEPPVVCYPTIEVILARLCWAVSLLAASSARAEEPPPLATGSIDRGLRELLFLDLEIGTRYRRASYDQSATLGPDDQGELRVHIAGSGGGDGGPLGAFVGVDLISRLKERAAGAAPDPFADPYDRFGLERNLRIYGAHAELVLRDERRRVRLAVRAGRLSDLDPRARLLLYDGGRVEVGLGGGLSLTALGGRRATLDAGLADRRDGVAAALVAGGSLIYSAAALRLEAGYRFEDLHRPSATFTAALGEDLHLSGGVEGLIADRPADLAGGSAAIDPSSEAAVILRAGGDWRSSALTTALYAEAELQLGRDPRPFGRGGRGPTSADLLSVIGLPLGESRLDRLFFGSEGSTVRGQLLAEHWLWPALGLVGGAFARVPLDGKSGFFPQRIEVWAGPELAPWPGLRVGLEGRLSLEDPGEPGRIFSLQGDGVRTFTALTLHAEWSVALNEDWRLGVRPEGELSSRATEGPFADTRGQIGVAGGGLITLASASGLRAMIRYGLERLPQLDADGVLLVQAVEGFVGGNF
jgi:hypothetical protein